MWLADLFLGEETSDEHVETESVSHQDTEHQDQDNMGEQHASRYDALSDSENTFGDISIGEMFADITGMLNDLGDFSLQSLSILQRGEVSPSFDATVDRPTESTLGAESENGESEKADRVDESANS